MSEQHTPPEGEATPDTPAQGTEQTPDQLQDQLKELGGKRYEDVQAWATKVASENADLRRQQDDIDYFRELAARHGYQLEEDDETEDDTQLYEDPSERTQAELEQVKAYLAAQQQEQQQEQQLSYLEASVEQQLSELPDGLTEKQKDWIVSRAIALPATEQGLPDITAAHAEFEDLRQEDQRTWARTKRAPHISPNGQAATQQKNVVDMTRQERQDWMAEQLAANEQ